MKILIKNGHLIDPSSDLDGLFDILISGEKIEDVIPSAKRVGDLPCRTEIPSVASLPRDDVKRHCEEARRRSFTAFRTGSAISDVVLDATNLIISPGFIDLHVHFREPGFTHKETLESGARCAIAGGFSTVCCMANTKPVVDTPELVKWIKERSREIGLAEILPVAALTIGQQGSKLTAMEPLAKAGAAAFSDDGGGGVINYQIMKEGLLRAKKLNLPVIDHCEDPNLVADGVMNAGKVSLQLGLAGNPADAETLQIERDIKLAKETGSHLHIAHLTTKGGVELIRRAKMDGVNVTTEVTPHHLTLSENDITKRPYDTNLKIAPPLRKEEDVEALKAGLMDGTIDIFATDHAPHSFDEKSLPFSMAPFGVTGLETALPIYLTLVEKGILSLRQVVEKLSSAPAKLLGKKDHSIKKGGRATLTIFDPSASFTINAKNSFSKSLNNPFDGWKVKGRVLDVFINGKHLFKNGVLQ
ncbi:MAG: hypothetical protein A3F16_05950 [Deltaproteobacteria bacterium RIFCSPHIGHO2_12_FULL_43_9]|nr:MAG: hypothetical protein A3F16_05950 [Deltaproteobacteria bacterium RIFCSPHIGHO2_12_FULL_43_9]